MKMIIIEMKFFVVSEIFIGSIFELWKKKLNLQFTNHLQKNSLKLCDIYIYIRYLSSVLENVIDETNRKFNFKYKY